jgi:hypothetical protein
MTWGEFKAAVEAQGVEDDDELDHIDCSPIDAVSVHVHRDEPDGPFYVWDVRRQ